MLNYQNIQDRAVIHNYFAPEKKEVKRLTRWQKVKEWFKNLRYVKIRKLKR